MHSAYQITNLEGSLSKRKGRMNTKMDEMRCGRHALYDQSCEVLARPLSQRLKYKMLAPIQKQNF